MTINSTNTALTELCADRYGEPPIQDEQIRCNVNYTKLAQVIEYISVHGNATNYEIMRQLAITRHTCRTVVNGCVFPLK